MIRLSVNVVTGSLILMEKIDEDIFRSAKELSLAPSIAQISVEDLFEFIATCKWVEIKNDAPKITASGEELLLLNRLGKYEHCFRKAMYSYIVFVRPIWSSRIPYGRKEASLFMSKDERACLMEGNLLVANPSPSTVEWWDELAAIIRKQTSEKKNNVGRIGERLTIEYERARTATEPQWMSIDSNLAGYDIKSVETKENRVPIFIEVKTTEMEIEVAEFHVTSHEWKVASNTNRYLFYLWLIGNQNKYLAKLDKTKIKEYIPINQNDGMWESVKIPFKPFENDFIEV